MLTMAVCTSPFCSLYGGSRQLLYTALSRAQRLCILVGDYKVGWCHSKMPAPPPLPLWWTAMM